MSVREQVSHNQVGSAHLVQFFDCDETRQNAVARFVIEGYRNGSPVIIIARPLNSGVIVDRLEKAGATIKKDIASGRLIVLDASATLRRISRNGSPDATQFDEVVGTLARKVSRHGRVCAYGEMVDLLAQRSDFEDAAVLEDLWNRLLCHVPLSLMCGYSAAHFVSAGSSAALRGICAAHTDVQVEAQDPLAAWVLATATSSIDSASSRQ